MSFYEAMRALAGHLMLHIAMISRQNGETFVIIEDGGYIAPAINRLCLEQRTLAFAADFSHFGVVGASICKPEWIEQRFLATEKQHLFLSAAAPKPRNLPS